MNPSLRVKLQDEVLDASWQDLAPHFARQALLWVAPHVDLLDVAVAMAEDDLARVQDWLGRRDVLRPGESMAAQWALEPPRFQAVIVQPWVIAQELGSAPTSPTTDA